MDVLNFSFFPFKKKIDTRSIKIIEKYEKLLFVDSAPFEFGILSGIMSSISVNSKKKFTNSYLSPKNHPAPSAVKLVKNYYIDYRIIIKKILSELKLNTRIELKKQSFDEKILWPQHNLKNLI